MKKIKGSGIKILKIIHLLFSFMWIGGGLCMVLLLLTTTPLESHEMYMRSFALKMVDDYLVIPGALGCFFTGIIYGIWTNWGFFKYKWITVKWILCVAMILSGTFLMGPWVNGNVYQIQDISKYTPDNSEFFYNVSQTIIWGSIQVSSLLIVVIISVFKPWKSKTK
jgi:hypothetical protein